MIKEYVEVFDTVFSCLSRIGFALFENKDYCAYFGNGTGWVVALEGDRYQRSGFSILLEYSDQCIGELPDTMPETREKYALWIVMEAFEKLYGIPHVKPSLVNQLEFLYRYQADLFMRPVPYAAQYEELNRVT